MSDVNKLTIEEIKAFKAIGLLLPKRLLTAKEAADVCREGRFSHFQSEVRPSSTMNKDAIEEHIRIADVQGQINLHGTNREGLTGLIETNEVR